MTGLSGIITEICYVLIYLPTYSWGERSLLTHLAIYLPTPGVGEICSLIELFTYLLG